MEDLTRAAQLRGDLEAAGFALQVDADEIVVSHARRRLTAAELAEIARVKPQLLRLLRGESEPAPEPPPAREEDAIPPWLRGPCGCPDCAREDAEAHAAREVRRFDRFRGY